MVCASVLTIIIFTSVIADDDKYSFLFLFLLLFVFFLTVCVFMPGMLTTAVRVITRNQNRLIGTVAVITWWPLSPTEQTPPYTVETPSKLEKAPVQHLPGVKIGLIPGT